MKKEPNLTEEFNSMMEKLSKKRDKSIAEFEEFKKRAMIKMDIHLDKLYQKRDYLKEVLANKKEFRKYRLGVWKKFIHTTFWTTLKFIFSMPFIYVMIFPGIILHIFLELYHQVCFRLYEIPLVKPKEYFIFDRSRLPYLNWLEKVNCAYCSYYTCLASYLQEIVGRTERFWCPIKHAKRMANTHQHYEQFIDYSDAKHLRTKWKQLRKFEKVK